MDSPGGEARSSDCHSLTRGEGFRERYRPPSRDSGQFGKAAVVSDPQIVTMRKHVRVNREPRIRGLCHSSRQVDARDKRIAPRDLAVRAGSERIFVVHGRVRHPNRDVTGCKQLGRPGLQTERNLLSAFVRHQGTKGIVGSHLVATALNAASPAAPAEIGCIPHIPGCASHVQPHAHPTT